MEKGNCESFGPATLALSESIMACVASGLRQKATAKAERMRVGVPGPESEPETLAMVEVWSICDDFTVNDPAAGFFFVSAHMLLNPYRLIVVPLTVVGDIGLLAWPPKPAECPWAFYTIYEFVNECIGEGLVGGAFLRRMTHYGSLAARSAGCRHRDP